MKKQEILDSIGKEVTRVWGFNKRLAEPVTILGYGYDYNMRYGRDRKIVQTPRATKTLARDPRGKEILVASRELLNRPYAEHKAEQDAQDEADRQLRIAQHEDRQRRIATGDRLVELLGFGNVETFDGYGAKAGAVTIKIDDVPKLIDKLEQEM